MLGIEKFMVEVAGIFKADLKRVMKEHGINNQQDAHQRLLKNVIDADFGTATKMLEYVTTPYEGRCSRKSQTEGNQRRQPGRR